MAAVSQTIALGAAKFGTTARARDDAGDNKLAGGTTYSHNVLQFSATEAGEWQSWMLYVETQVNLARFFKCV